MTRNHTTYNRTRTKTLVPFCISFPDLCKTEFINTVTGTRFIQYKPITLQSYQCSLIACKMNTEDLSTGWIDIMIVKIRHNH